MAQHALVGFHSFNVVSSRLRSILITLLTEALLYFLSLFCIQFSLIHHQISDNIRQMNIMQFVRCFQFLVYSFQFRHTQFQYEKCRQIVCIHIQIVPFIELTNNFLLNNRSFFRSWWENVMRLKDARDAYILKWIKYGTIGAIYCFKF